MRLFLFVVIITVKYSFGYKFERVKNILPFCEISPERKVSYMPLNTYL